MGGGWGTWLRTKVPKGQHPPRASRANKVEDSFDRCLVLDRTPGAELFVEAVRSVGAESGIPVVRRAELMRQWVVAGAVTPSQLVGRDGLHMTDAGYALLAVAIAEQMQAEASARSSPVTELARDGRNAGPEGSA